MTSNELRVYFNETYGAGERPKIFEVDHETYANVCQEIFNQKVDRTGSNLFTIMVGITNNGIFFKGIELILKDK